MGSLFQLRDFWGVSYAEEEFGSYALTAGDVANEGLFERIILGSFQGYLRIFNPSNERGGMYPGDILLETKYDEPILQVRCGPFEPVSRGSPRQLLAILFPRRLLLVKVERKGGTTGVVPAASPESSNPSSKNEETALSVFYELKTYFTAHFEHTAYNFTSGPFGRVGYDMICVQSMDGQLTIVDHNKVLLRRFLPSNQFLIPGCLAYCAARDTFLTNNTSLFLMCYNFSTITSSVGSEEKDVPPRPAGARVADAEASDAAAQADSNAALQPSAGGGMKINPAWAFNLGDDAVAIEVCRLTRGTAAKDADIVVLCPYVLYVLSLSGECRVSRRLDVESSCLGIYSLSEADVHNLLIGTCGGSLNVYSDVALEWSAKMQSGTPQNVLVGVFCGVPGMIAAMNSEGTLSINYLGTDPADGPIQPLESKVANYEEMNRELRHAYRGIKRAKSGHEDDAAKSSSAEPSPKSLASPNDPRSSLDVHFTSPSASTVAGDDSRVSLSLVVTLRKGAPLAAIDDASVLVEAVEPIQVVPRRTAVTVSAPGEAVTIPIEVSAVGHHNLTIPSSLVLKAVVLCKGARGGHLVCQAEALLPFALVARPQPPIKSNTFSLQLNTEQSPPPSLLELFADIAAYGNVAANVMSVRYLNGADATVLVSKNAARFKVQGSTMEGLWMLTSELMRRTLAHFQVTERPFSFFEVPHEVPLQDFFSVIDTHVTVRKELQQATSELEKAAQLLRAVEKRLLAHVRDKTPSNTDAIETLFEESYRLLQHRADAVTLAKARSRQACAMLNCCAQLVFLCLCVKFHATLGDEKGDAHRLLKVLFSCDISGDDGLGWEEVVDAALVRLLHVKSNTVQRNTLELSLDVNSLKKCLRMLVEHLTEGRDWLA